MLLVVFVCHLIVRVLSGRPPPPHDVHVNKSHVTWSPAAAESDITYTVQFRSLGSTWTDVRTCVSTTSTSCDVTSIKHEGGPGCMELRVRAKRQRLESDAAEACSTRSGSCTPEFRLSARPGSLTVHLSRNHSLVHQDADHIKHRVFYGRAGEPLTDHKDSLASVIIDGLQPGQRYCAKVQYTKYDKPLGPLRCARCELIAETTRNKDQAVVIVPAVVVFLLLCVTPVMAYCLIYKREQIKECLRPPYEIPTFFLEPIPENYRPVSVGSPTESCDNISLIIPEDTAELQGGLKTVAYTPRCAT